MALIPSAEELNRIVADGESQTVEFKSRMAPDATIARTLAAFANSRGGMLLLGVGDSGEIVGLSDIDVERALRRLKRIADQVLPFPTLIDTRVLHGRTILVAVVNPAPEYLRPVTIASGEAFIRRGATSIPFAFEEQDSEPSVTAESLVVSGRRVRVFVAMSFRSEQEPALVDYWKAMERATKRTGLPLDLVRIDLVEGDFEISQQIMNEIDACDIVIADFTLSPHNVYFELGYARGCKSKQIVQTSRKGVELQFDIRNWRTEIYTNATELEEKLIPALRASYIRVQAAK